MLPVGMLLIGNAGFPQQGDEDEVFILSPFEVSSGESAGYGSSSTLAGTRSKTKLKDIGSSVSVIQAFNDGGAGIEGIESGSRQPFRTASSVRVEFAIGYFHEKEAARREQLYTYLAAAEALIKEQPGLRFELGELRIPEGDLKRVRSSSRASFTSYGFFSVSFDLDDSASPFRRVDSVRRLAGKLQLDARTCKLFYGDATTLSERTEFFSRISKLTAAAPLLVDGSGKELLEKSPSVPVSITIPGDYIEIPFAISLYGPDSRRRESKLEELLAKIESSVLGDPKLSYQPNSLELSEASYSEQNLRPKIAFSSSASFSLRLDIASGQTSGKDILAAQQLVRGIELATAGSKVDYRRPRLVLKDPSARYFELVDAILGSSKQLDERLGDSQSVKTKIPNSKILLKRSTLTEVAIWLPYSIKIVHEDERAAEALRLEREHEIAVAMLSAKARCNCEDDD